MNIKARAQGFKLSLAMHDHINSRLYLALGRYYGKIQQAEVTLVKIEDAEDGKDQQCEIKLQLDHLKDVVVTERGDDLRQTINTCVHWAKRAVERHHNYMRRMNLKRYYGYN
ncbi:HPF/RaiA family ribosome-associated protein [Exilibacterium tricleocarpae]|uniref:HPF/RaiA family ribosome-associated protein n=1 Tax=Exilibacterium tricleocarpae TaxID=2591008 RepID=A0A545U6Q9_9GAMM|nr:HPF/RaiA family ribosome-associated protein [Exilibacterium tricleocarpae]TQV85124.1 HPF/RaiA family ribosome-associated protein [Exilibacterium tricleocarpae]